MKSSFAGKRVIIIGAARQGIALARFLAECGAKVTLNDQRSAGQFASVQSALAGLDVTWVFGEHPLELLDQADMVCPSGGVPLTLPLVQEARHRGILLSNDSQIFLELAPCPVIGITGSAGKTTTTTLVGRIAKNAFQSPNQVWVGGNIGRPLLLDLDEMKPGDLAVMELSSFQLEIMTRSPQIAAILNITPNHLDRHSTMEAYIRAKAQILACQNFGDTVVLCREDPEAWRLRDLAQGQVWAFGHQLAMDYPGSFVAEGQVWLWDGRHKVAVIELNQIELRGEHNLLNVLAACAICAVAGLPAPAMRAGIQGFRGVAHRLEFVRQIGGVAWYNDSIATAPERAMAAIRSFHEPVVLLAGGRDKNLPWNGFAELVRKRVDHLVLFGEAAKLIQDAVNLSPAGERPYTLTICDHLLQAVQAAAKVAEPGDVVLFSPGGTSFDEFSDFEARGEAYRKWVLELS